MAVRTNLDNIEGTTYSITFTCQHWLPLFEKANSYNVVYKAIRQNELVRELYKIS